MPKPLEDDTPPLVLYNRQNVKQIDIISNPKPFSSNRYITEQFHYEPLGHNVMKHVSTTIHFYLLIHFVNK